MTPTPENIAEAERLADKLCSAALTSEEIITTIAQFLQSHDDAAKAETQKLQDTQESLRAKDDVRILEYGNAPAPCNTASLPDCDICHKPQTQLGAVKFSPTDRPRLFEKTHICVECDAKELKS
jgi:hypothetical protein